MEHQKIIVAKTLTATLILAVILLLSGLLTLLTGLTASLANGDYIDAAISSFVGIAQLVAVFALVMFAIRGRRNKRNYEEAKSNGEILIYPEYISETGSRTNNVNDYEILFSYSTPLKMTLSIRGIPFNDPFFYEVMRTVPLTVYHLGGEYYTSSLECVRFEHDLMVQYSEQRRKIMEEIQQ